VALLGTNGAGKSTLLRAIAGLMRPTAGEIHFKGEDVTGARPRRLVDMGMIYIAGGRAVVPVAHGAGEPEDERLPVPAEPPPGVRADR
jgi:branched-chain amino acid transport system ATP-binding protein